MQPADTTLTASPVTDPRRANAILRVLVGATFVVILNETIMVNAIPRLMHDFDVTARAAQWLSTAFMLTLAVVIPATGWLLQRFTTRQVFSLAMGLFTTGTVLAMLAPSFPVLLGARIVQASGTAVMMPLLMTTLLTVVPMQRRGKVMGNVTLVMAVAPAMGPAVSGLLLQLGSWRFIFAVTLPIAVGMFAYGLRTLVDVGETAAGSLDIPSLVLAALGFGGFVYGLSQLGADDGGLPAGPTIAVGALVVAAFVWRQLALQRQGRPLLDLRALTHRTFAVALAVMCLAFMAMMGAMIVLPLYLQSVEGLTPLATGLLLMPGGLVMGLLGPTVGSLFDRYGARALVVPGSVVLLAALTGLATLGVGTPGCPRCRSTCTPTAARSSAPCNRSPRPSAPPSSSPSCRPGRPRSRRRGPTRCRRSPAGSAGAWRSRWSPASGWSCCPSSRRGGRSRQPVTARRRTPYPTWRPGTTTKGPGTASSSRPARSRPTEPPARQRGPR